MAHIVMALIVMAYIVMVPRRRCSSVAAAPWRSPAARNTRKCGIRARAGTQRTHARTFPEGGCALGLPRSTAMCMPTCGDKRRCEKKEEQNVPNARARARACVRACARAAHARACALHTLLPPVHCTHLLSACLCACVHTHAPKCARACVLACGLASAHACVRAASGQPFTGSRLHIVMAYIVMA